MPEDRVWDLACQILVAFSRRPMSQTGEAAARAALETARALDGAYSEHITSLDPTKQKDPRLPSAIKILGIMLEDHERLRTSNVGEGWEYHQGAMDVLVTAMDCVGRIFSGKAVNLDFTKAESPPKPYTVVMREQGIAELILTEPCEWGSDKAHFELLKLVEEVEGGITVNLDGVCTISLEWLRFLAALSARCEVRNKMFKLTNLDHVVRSSIDENKLSRVFNYGS